MSIEFDPSRWPLLTVRLGPYSGAEWNQMLLELIALIERGPFGAVVDLRAGQMPNAVQRRSFIDMYERYDRLTQAHFLALGAVGDSTVLRGVITALNWLRPAPHPVKVFSTLDAAETWVLEQLPEPVRQRVPSRRPRGQPG
ncbi:MAG: hypothetical protein ABI895_20970 [Deltaproteobacteria bacterium]